MTANQYSWLQHYCLNFSAVPNYNRHTLLHPPVCCVSANVSYQKKFFFFLNTILYCLFVVVGILVPDTFVLLLPSFTISLCLFVCVTHSSFSKLIRSVCVSLSIFFGFRFQFHKYKKILNCLFPTENLCTQINEMTKL